VLMPVFGLSDHAATYDEVPLLGLRSDLSKVFSSSVSSLLFWNHFRSSARIPLLLTFGICDIADICCFVVYRGYIC
jgi:hypothetical protein